MKNLKKLQILLIINEIPLFIILERRGKELKKVEFLKKLKTSIFYMKPEMF